MSSHLLPATDYEPRDAPPGRLLLVGGGVAAGILLSLAIALGLYLSHNDRTPRSGVIGRQTSFRDSPHARTDIAADWRRLDREITNHLNTYGWIDRPAGVVRIPIDVAMQRLVDEARAQNGGKP